ncbi:hypothetical protein [Candidatus Regiella insecticola]|uniref:hypothetical protein n=1 Tax=Candidatus Regiella insecticola TaxID=138073 RepID=UPI000587ADC4|nr:hypothetical protein [Candidatus Regiella insecticola]
MLTFDAIWPYMPFAFEVAAKRPGRPTDERGHTMKARAGSQQRGGFKGEGHMLLLTIDLFENRSSLCGVKAPGAQQPSLT